LTSGRRPVVKIIAESVSHDEKHVVPTPLSGIRVGGRFIIIHDLITPFFHMMQVTETWLNKILVKLIAGSNSGFVNQIKKIGQVFYYEMCKNVQNL
jgi:hypothetical protein